jgi:hypothetical protein
MYGTIARLHPTSGRIEDLVALQDRWRLDEAERPAGYRSAWLFLPDQNPYDRPTVFLVAVFDDRPTYVANAQSPAQDARYQEMRALLEDDPEWIDGFFFGD